jgi:hypothetical protein
MVYDFFGRLQLLSLGLCLLVLVLVLNLRWFDYENEDDDEDDYPQRIVSLCLTVAGDPLVRFGGRGKVQSPYRQRPRFH